MAAAFSIVQCILRLPGIVYCFRTSPLRVADLLTVLWRPALASTVAAAALLLFSWGVSYGRYALPLVLGVDLLVFAAAYVLAWVWVPGGRHTLRDMFALARELRRKPGGTGRI